MDGGQQQNQRRKNGHKEFQPVRAALKEKVIGVFPLPESQRRRQKQKHRNNVIRHFRQTFPSTHAAVTPSPAEHRLVTHTAGRISKGVAQPRALRTAATFAGIS